MSVLLAFLYADEKIADEALESLEDLMHDGHLDLEDACVVVKDTKGKVYLHQEVNMSFFGAISGLVFGTIIGWILLLPYLGIPAAILGALTGKIGDQGISDRYMKNLSKKMKPQSSALFILARNSSLEAIINALVPYGGSVFHTSLDSAQEQEFEEKFEQLRPGKKPEIDRSPEMHD